MTDPITLPSIRILFCLNQVDISHEKTVSTLASIIKLIEENKDYVQEIHFFDTAYQTNKGFYIVNEIMFMVLDRYFKSKKFGIDIFIHLSYESLLKMYYRNYFHIIEYRDISNKTKSYDIYQRDSMIKQIVSNALMNDGYFITDSFDYLPNLRNVKFNEYAIIIYTIDNGWTYRNMMTGSSLNNQILTPKRFKTYEQIYFLLTDTDDQLTDICYFYERVCNTIRKYILICWTMMVILLFFPILNNSHTIESQLFTIILLVSLISTKLRNITWLFDLDILTDIVNTARVTTYKRCY